MSEVLKIKVITLSDRAYSGEYEDKSGPVVKDKLNEYFSKVKRSIEIDSTILPDESSMLEEILIQSVVKDFKIIITTGATGIGPRDIAPDVVKKFAYKEVPGIMNQIRMKYGTVNPNALVSRSMCAVKNDTIIYTLPGSPKAVFEYMEEILKNMEHMLLMITGEGH